MNDFEKIADREIDMEAENAMERSGFGKKPIGTSDREFFFGAVCFGLPLVLVALKLLS